MTPAFLSETTPWIEETLDKLSLEQRIAQLIHIPSWSNRSEIHVHELVECIKKYQIGGVIFFQGDPLAQARATQRYQAASHIPLMISMDAEWGLAMRLEQAVQYPYQMSLGAVQDLSLIEEMGAQLARQCRRLGVHVNFAPSVDINTEAANPVIGFRSFGSDPVEVAKRASAYMRGMQKERVMAVAKHFPGHGDTAVDSHLDLPVLTHDRARLHKVELAPFRDLIAQGVGGVMTGHLHVPAFDSDTRLGASLSHALTQGLLKDELGFEGLVFTDALDMKGVTKHFSPAEINARALLAGHDVLLFCVDVPGSIAAIMEAIKNGQISKEEITRRCRKSLMAKAWLMDDAVLRNASLAAPTIENVVAEVNPPESDRLNRDLAAQIITCVKGADRIPLPPETRLASLAVISDYNEHADRLAHHELTHVQEASAADDQMLTTFQQTLTQQLEGRALIDHFVLDLSEPETMQKWTVKAIREFQWVIVSLHGLHIKASHRFGITEALQMKLGAILAESRVILVVFGNAYLLEQLEDIEKAEAIVLAYQETDALQMAAAEVVLGKVEVVGRMPV